MGLEAREINHFSANSAELIGGYTPRILDLRQRLNVDMGFGKGTYVRQERDFRTALIQLPEGMAARVSMEEIEPISYDFDFNVRCIVAPRYAFDDLVNNFHMKPAREKDVVCTTYLSFAPKEIVFYLQQPNKSNHLSFPEGVKTDGSHVHYLRRPGLQPFLGLPHVATVAHVVTELEKVARYLEGSSQVNNNVFLQEYVYQPPAR